MTQDQQPETAEPTADDVTASEPEATETSQEVAARGEGSSGDEDDESKTGRGVDRVE